jgi:hypothetical protein
VTNYLKIETLLRKISDTISEGLSLKVVKLVTVFRLGVLAGLTATLPIPTPLETFIVFKRTSAYQKSISVIYFLGPILMSTQQKTKTL